MLSTRDVTFSAAISARLATSRRISASALRLRFDLAARLLQPPLAVLFGLQPHALALRVGHASRLGEDLVRLAARLAEQLPMLLQEPARLVACLVGLFDRLPNALAALVDRLLNRSEREPPPGRRT